MNSLFVVSLGFGLTILAAGVIYLVYLKRKNKQIDEVTKLRSRIH